MNSSFNRLGCYGRARAACRNHPRNMLAGLGETRDSTTAEDLVGAAAVGDALSRVLGAFTGKSGGAQGRTPTGSVYSGRSSGPSLTTIALLGVGGVLLVKALAR